MTMGSGLVAVQMIFETITEMTSPLRYEILKLITCHWIICILHVFHDRDSHRWLIAMIMDHTATATATAIAIVCMTAGARLICCWDLVGDLNYLTTRGGRFESLSWLLHISWIIVSIFLIKLGIHPGRIFELVWMFGRAWNYTSPWTT